MSRSNRREVSRNAILAEGFKCLSRQGYNGTGLKQILDTVKIPKGSFYYYFESKEHFAVVVIERYIDRLLAIFDEHLGKNPDDPIKSIKTLYHLIVKEFDRAQCAQGCLIGGLAAELGNQNKPLQLAMQQAYSKWADRFLPLVIQAQNQNLIRTDISAEEITEMFWCMWEGAILKMKIDGNTNILNRMLSVTLDGLLQTHS